MSHLSSNDILQYTLVAANTLQGVAADTGVPFLESLCNIALTLIPVIESNHFQRDRCLRMTEQIHKSLCALGALCLGSEDTRPPVFLDQMAQYARTLQAFYSYLKAQQDLGKIKRFFKQGEITTQLEVYEREVTQAANIFSMHQGVGLSAAAETQRFDAESRHQELLELLSAVSIDASSLRESSFTTSRGSLSHLLPASPKIFHGRDSELNDMIDILLADRPRVAILGSGGIGKTTLALAALHNPVVIDRYNQRHFIPCETASSSADLASIMGSILGLEPSKQLSRVIVAHFAESGPTLILLDNFETPWEPLESRAGVEEFISLLADIPTLALLITMRGAERPGKVKWSRPFLPVLEPLSKKAAHQVFADIAGEPSFKDQIAFDKLLDLSGGLPLAVSLLASVASFEGYSDTLDRWNVENTSLLSDGVDKSLNLEKSIMLSLGSPRISSSAHTRELLSLLCLLPGGITEAELVTSRVLNPTGQISHSKSTLLRTSLAYIDFHGRLRILNPIRQYVRSAHPPPASLYWPLVRHFQELLHLWYSHQDLSSGDLVPHLGSHIGNIRELLLQGPPPDTQAEYLTVGHGIIELVAFMRLMLMGTGGDSLMKKLPHLIELTSNSRLRWAYTCDYLRGLIPPLVPDADRLMTEGLEYFATVQSPVEEIVTFHNALASYAYNRNINGWIKFGDLALSLAKRTSDFRLILDGLNTKFLISQDRGELKQAWETAREAQAIGRLSSSFESPVWNTREVFIHVDLGNLSRAFDLCEQVEAQLSRSGLKGTDKPLVVLDIRADIHLRKSEYIEARKMQALIASRTSPNLSPKYHANSLTNIAFLDILTGSNEAEIRSSLDAAKSVYAFLGDQRIQLCDWVTAELYLLQGKIKQARSLFEQTASTARHSDIRRDCLASLGDPRHGMHTLLATFRWAVAYLAFSQRSGDRVGTLQAFRRLAEIFIRMDEEQAALELFRTGLEEATELDIHRLRAECMVGIGDIMVRRGSPGEAEKMYRAAHPLFMAASRRKDASAVEERLNGR